MPSPPCRRSNSQMRNRTVPRTPSAARSRKETRTTVGYALLAWLIIGRHCLPPKQTCTADCGALARAGSLRMCSSSSSRPLCT